MKNFLLLGLLCLSSVMSNQQFPLKFYRNFVWCENHVYCWNHKAASTTILRQMSESCGFQGLFNHNDISRLIEFAVPRDNEELMVALNTSMVFSSIRHPYTRLVSAYKDRLIKNPDSWQARKFVPLIMKGKNGTLTFPDFVNFITKNPDNLDSHWIPWTQHCRPDSVNYDFLFRVENLQKNIKDYFKTEIDFHQTTTKEETSEMMKTLNAEQKNGLKILYHDDFQGLNYSENLFL